MSRRDFQGYALLLVLCLLVFLAAAVYQALLTASP